MHIFVIFLIIAKDKCSIFLKKKKIFNIWKHLTKMLAFVSILGMK